MYINSALKQQTYPFFISVIPSIKQNSQQSIQHSISRPDTHSLMHINSFSLFYDHVSLTSLLVYLWHRKFLLAKDQVASRCLSCDGNPGRMFAVALCPNLMLNCHPDAAVHSYAAPAARGFSACPYPLLQCENCFENWLSSSKPLFDKWTYYSNCSYFVQTEVNQWNMSIKVMLFWGKHLV